MEDYYSDSAAEEGSELLASLRSLGDAQGEFDDLLGGGMDMAIPSLLKTINKTNKVKDGKF